LAVEAAARQRRHQHRHAAQGFYFLRVARHVDGEFGDEVGGAAGLARLVVVAELDQHIGGAEAGAVVQQALHFIPAAFGAEAAAAAAAARQVDAGVGAVKRAQKASP
jgi:hypothetical protein